MIDRQTFMRFVRKRPDGLCIDAFEVLGHEADDLSTEAVFEAMADRSSSSNDDSDGLRARVSGMTFEVGGQMFRREEADDGTLSHVPTGVYDAGEIRIHVVTDTRDPRHVSPDELVEALRRFLEVSEPDYVPSQIEGCLCHRVGPHTYMVHRCPVHGGAP